MEGSGLTPEDLPFLVEDEKKESIKDVKQYRESWMIHKLFTIPSSSPFRLPSIYFNKEKETTSKRDEGS